METTADKILVLNEIIPNEDKKKLGLSNPRTYQINNKMYNLYEINSDDKSVLNPLGIVITCPSHKTYVIGLYSSHFLPSIYFNTIIFINYIFTQKREA